MDQFRGAYQQGLLAEPMFSGSTGSGSSALMRSLLGQGEYADAGMILPFAKTPSGENVFSFPAPIQAIARTSARAMGGMPLEFDPYTGLPAENLLADAAEAAGAFTGAGLLTPRQAGQKLLYRYDAPTYKSPGEGAVFFSSDKTYADLYGSEGRLLRQAETPRDVFDIRSSDNSDLVLSWAANKADELEQSGISNIRKGIEQGGAAGASRALAALNLAYDAVPGRAEKMFMSDFDIGAMTIKEAGRAGDDYSVAFRDTPRDVSSDITLGMGGRVKPPTKTELDPLGYGAVKFDRAVPDIDVRVTGTNQPNLPRKAATIEDLQGKVLMPVYWDKSSNRGLLTGIDETDLARPVLLEGGPDFMVGPAAQAERAMLASGQGIVSTLSNRAKKLAEETGKDIVGTTVTMAPDAVDFTTFMSRALAEQLPAASITKKAMKSFDVEMKKVDKNWPGVGSENIGDYLSSASSDVRKKFVRTMDKKPFYEAGFPSVGKTRVAVTEPDLVDVPAGRAGFALGQIDLDAPLLLNPKVPHETYPVQMVGDYLGGFENPIPQSLLWRDAIKGMEGRTYFDKKLGREVPWSDATRAYTLKTQLPGQLVDQELVDALMQYSLLGK
jgi:hypothetical protein